MPACFQGLLLLPSYSMSWSLLRGYRFCQQNLLLRYLEAPILQCTAHYWLTQSGCNIQHPFPNLALASITDIPSKAPCIWQQSTTGGGNLPNISFIRSRDLHLNLLHSRLPSPQQPSNISSRTSQKSQSTLTISPSSQSSNCGHEHSSYAWQVLTTFVAGGTNTLSILTTHIFTAFSKLELILPVDQNAGNCLVKGSTCAPLQTSVPIWDPPQEPAKKQSGAAAADRTPTPKSVTVSPNTKSTRTVQILSHSKLYNSQA